jgi:glycosyltransferase involved in cell wall biosynthesis
MNILLINHYAGSPRHGMEYRPYYLAREWVRAGHRVQIVAGGWSHVRAVQPELGSPPRVLDEVIAGIHYRWLPLPRYASNGIGRLFNIAAFLWGVWRRSAALAGVNGGAPRPDVVIASSTYPMDIWVARRIARRACALLVHEVHDLWPASPMALAGMSRWHPFILLCQKAENDACRDADRVVSMLPKVAEHLQAHGLDPKRLHIVPNGVAPDDWAAPPAPLDGQLAAHVAAARRAGRLLVGYTGSHGVPNALDVLLDAAALLKDRPISFLLVGDGMEKTRLAARVRDEGLAHVALFAPIPKPQLPALLRELDVAYIGWLRMPLYRYGIAPNKLMDYMMAGCAVLHSVEAGNDPVADAGCGLTVASESPAAVAEGLQRLLALSPAERAAMGARGRAYVVAHHTYPVLAQRFLVALGAAHEEGVGAEVARAPERTEAGIAAEAGPTHARAPSAEHRP